VFASTIFFEIDNINYLLIFILILSIVFLVNFYTYINSIYILMSLLWNGLLVIVFDFTFFFSLFIVVYITTLNLYLLTILLLVVMAELGWVPVDILERESEIVSGTNIEFSGVSFTFIFLYEYYIMLIFSIFLGCVFQTMTFILFTIFILFIRNVLPRYTIYDLVYFILGFINIVIFVFYFT